MLLVLLQLLLPRLSCFGWCIVLLLLLCFLSLLFSTLSMHLFFLLLLTVLLHSTTKTLSLGTFLSLTLQESPWLSSWPLDKFLPTAILPQYRFHLFFSSVSLRGFSLWLSEFLLNNLAISISGSSPILLGYDFNYQKPVIWCYRFG